MKPPSQILLLLTILLFLPGQVPFAQCTNGSQPECKCSTAPVLCTIDDLDGYSFSMTSYDHPNDGPSPICPGAGMTQTNNPTWFAFTAWCSDLSLRVTSSNCHQSQGYVGFQLAIYSDCTFSHLVACNADVNDCNTNDKILNLTGLNIGAVYYFMVDGCLGSYCTVTIDVIGVCGQEHIDAWTQPVSGNRDPCVGNSETYAVEDLNGARIYHWYVDGILMGQTSEENFTINWTIPGTYELCIDASNDPCIEVSDPPGPLCTMITVHDADPGVLTLTDTVLCLGDSIFVSSPGYLSGPYNTQMLLFVDDLGNVLDTINSDSGSFTSLIAGEFSVCAYNFTNAAVVPVVGQNIIDFDCSNSCCETFCRVIHYVEIMSVISDIICDDNGTGNDPSDDVFTFSVLMTGLSPGTRWRSMDGTIEGVYGTPTSCGPYPISGGTVHFDLRDDQLPKCWSSIHVDPPMSCSWCIQSMDAGPDRLLNCMDTVVTLTGTSSVTGSYHWTGPSAFSSDSLSAVVRDSGWYVLSIDFSNQCVQSDSVYVAQDIETPGAEAGADQQLDCQQKEVMLDASGSTGNHVVLQWATSTGQYISNQTQILVDSAGTYILQLTNAHTGCRSFDTVVVNLLDDDLGIIDVRVVDENCFGEEDGVIEVLNIPGGLPPYAYSLNGMNNSSGLIDHLPPGNYMLHISDANGCSADTSFTIDAGIDLQIVLPDRLLVTEDENKAIHASVNVPEGKLTSIQWTPPGVVLCDTCLSTFINTHISQSLSVTITYVNGCIATATLDILVVPTPDIFIPNTFSPNDDGINDRFTVYTNDGFTSILEFDIYDRWGEQLFHADDITSNDPALGWNGKFHDREMSPGTFVYSIKLKVADGTEKVVTGDVTLIR